MARQQRINLYGSFTPTGFDPTLTEKYQRLQAIGGQIADFGFDRLNKSMQMEGKKEAIEDAEAAKQATADRKAQLLEAGADPKKAEEMASTQLPKQKDPFTIKGQAYNQASYQAYQGEVRRDAKETINRLSLEHSDPVAFDNAVQAYKKGVTSGLPTLERAGIDGMLNNMISDASIAKANQAHMLARKEVLASNIANIEDLNDDLLNAAAAGDKEALATAIAQQDAVYDAMIADKSVSASEVARKREQRREQVVINQEIGKVESIQLDESTAIEKIEAIDKELARVHKSKFKDLNPDQKRAMIGRIERIKGDIVSKENARLSSQKSQFTAQAKHINEQVNQIKSNLNAGINIDSEQIEKVLNDANKLNNTAGKELVNTKEFANEIVEHKKVEAYSKLNASARTNVLQMLEQQENEGITAQEGEELQRIRKAEATIQREIKKDAISFYEQQGFIELNDIRLTDNDGNIDIAGFGQDLAGRTEIARQASAHYNADVSPLTREETRSITRMLDNLPASNQATILASMVNNMGDDSLPIFENFAKDGASVIAWAGGIAANGGNAEPVLQGRMLLKENKLLIPSKNEIDVEVLNTFGSAYSGNPSAQTAVLDSVKAAYATLSNEASDYSQILDSDRLKQAVMVATGGIVEFNDKKIPSPVHGTTQSDFETLIDKLRPWDLDRLDNNLAPGLTNESIVELIQNEDIALIPRGSGKYYLEKNDLFIQTDKGTPFVLDFKEILK